MSGLLDGLEELRVDVTNLHIPEDIAGTDNETLYRANAVGRDNGIVEAGIYVREALRSEAMRTLLWTAVEDELPDDVPQDYADRIVSAFLYVLAGDDQ